MPKLSTTSFALLGLLGRRAWSAYEMTKFMRHSILRAIWPRAESHIYSECKNLESHALVEGTRKATGKRRRTEYAINAAGQQALREWLAQPAVSRFSIESETLTKLVNADSAPRVIALLREFENEASQDAAWTRQEIGQFLEGSQEVPTGRDYNAMITLLLAEMVMVRLRWARRMSQRMEATPGTDDDGIKRALQLYREIDELMKDAAA